MNIRKTNLKQGMETVDFLTLCEYNEYCMNTNVSAAKQETARGKFRGGSYEL